MFAVILCFTANLIELLGLKKNKEGIYFVNCVFYSQLYCALAAKKELKTEIYFVNCVF